MNRKQSTSPYAVYVVEGEGDAAYRTKVGAAWPHEDGEGFNLQLAAVPLNGRLVVRKPRRRRRGDEPRFLHTQINGR